MNNKKYVSVTLVDGPHAGEKYEIFLMDCRDRIAFVADTWFKFNRDGSVSVVKGPINKGAPWSQYVKNIYKKEGKVKDFEVDYFYEESIAVDRCRWFLQNKNRLCGNDAEYGEKYCRVHLDIAKRGHECGHKTSCKSCKRGA